MATIDDLADQVAAWLTSLGFDSTRLWADRPTPISGQTRGFARVTSSSEVQLGSNGSLRIVELEVTFARKRGTIESYATVLDGMHIALANATKVSEWVNLAAVRQSPLPEIEIERDLEKVGAVLVFSIRAQVALEG